MVGMSVRTGSYWGTWDCAPGAAADAADASWATSLPVTSWLNAVSTSP